MGAGVYDIHIYGFRRLFGCLLLLPELPESHFPSRLAVGQNFAKVFKLKFQLRK